MSHFWTFESDLPSGMGVETLGSAHIIVLILSASLIFFIIQLYRKQSVLGKRIIKITVAALLVILYFSR